MYMNFALSLSLFFDLHKNKRRVNFEIFLKIFSNEKIATQRSVCKELSARKQHNKKSEL